MVSDELTASVVADIVLLKHIGIKPVLVHGGGKEVSAMMEKLGKKPRFVSGLRVTDDETMEVAEMVLLGNVNSRIVNLLNRCGARAVGLSGADAGLFQAVRKAPVSPGASPGEAVDLGRVGEIIRIDTALIKILARAAISQWFLNRVDLLGGLNINADHAAGELAGRCKRRS